MIICKKRKSQIEILNGPIARILLEYLQSVKENCIKSVFVNPFSEEMVSNFCQILRVVHDVCLFACLFLSWAFVAAGLSQWLPLRSVGSRAQVR